MRGAHEDAPAAPLRVGYVVKVYPRYSETFIVNEILAHEAAGLELEIFSLRPPRDTHFQDMIARVRAPVTYLDEPLPKAEVFWSAVRETARSIPDFWPWLAATGDASAGEIYAGLRLAGELGARRIGHLHAHFASTAVSVARLASAFAGIPYTCTAHAKDIFHESVQPGDLRRKLHDAAAVVTVSDYNLRYLRDTCGLVASRVHRIYNGLDLSRLPYRPPDPRSPLIVAVGRLVEKKGFRHLIDACAILSGRGVPFECKLLGTGELESELRAQVTRLGLENCVELCGPRPQADVLEIVGRASVFAAPCVVGADGNRDGLPTVILEAMALGTPCVATDVTGLPEVLDHARTGLMVPQNDPVALAEAIARLLGDPALRVRLAGAARRLIEKAFNIQQNTAVLRSLFQAAGRAPSGVRRPAMTTGLRV